MKQQLVKAINEFADAIILLNTQRFKYLEGSTSPLQEAIITKAFQVNKLSEKVDTTTIENIYKMIETDKPVTAPPLIAIITSTLVEKLNAPPQQTKPLATNAAISSNPTKEANAAEASNILAANGTNPAEGAKAANNVTDPATLALQPGSQLPESQAVSSTFTSQAVLQQNIPPFTSQAESQQNTPPFTSQAVLTGPGSPLPSATIITQIIKNFSEIVYPALETVDGGIPDDALAAMRLLCSRLTAATGATEVVTTATTGVTAGATAFVPYTPTNPIYPIEDPSVLPIYEKGIVGYTSKNLRTPAQTARKILVRLYYLLKKLITTSNVDETPAKTNKPKYIDLTDKTTSAVSNAMNNPSIQVQSSTNSTFIQSLYDLVQVYNDLIMTYYNQLKAPNPTEYQNANAIIEKYILTNGNNIIMPIDKSKSLQKPPIFPQRHYVVLGLMNNVIKYATLAYESLSNSSPPNQTNITNIQRVIAYLSHEMIDLLTLGDIAKMSGGGEEESKPKRKTLRRSKRVHKIEKDSSE